MGHAAFAARDGKRVFFHTEVADGYEGRGLATLLIGAALQATRADGTRIVPVCEMVAAYIDKHPEFADITDAATPEIRQGCPTSQAPTRLKNAAPTSPMAIAMAGCPLITATATPVTTATPMSSNSTPSRARWPLMDPPAAGGSAFLDCPAVPSSNLTIAIPFTMAWATV